MSNLGPQAINSSYIGVLQVPGGITNQLKNVQDGNGNTTGLMLSSSGSSIATSSSFVASANGVAIPSVVTRLISDGFGDYISVKDFGAVGDGVTNDTTAINTALASGYKIFFPSGTYKANIVSSLNNFYISGEGMGLTIISPYNTSLPAFKNMSNPGSANFWRRSRISDLSIKSSGSVGNGFTFGDPASYSVGDENIGRVDFENVEITGFNKAIFKTCGNISNSFTNCRVQNNNYNYYAQSSDYANVSAPAMHSGGDNFYSGAFGYAGLASIFIRDRINGHGGWLFQGVDIEGNTGYAIVALCSAVFGQVPDITIDSCWLEDNANGGSITIDGLTGTITGLPREIYAIGNHQIVAKSIYLHKITLLNGANLVAEKCGSDTVESMAFDLYLDSDSTFIADGWIGYTAFRKNLTLAPYASTSNYSNTLYTPSFNAQPSSIASNVQDYVVRLGLSGTQKRIFAGGTTMSSNMDNDGMSFNTCNSVIVTAYASAGTFTTVAGKYYAISFQTRLKSGDAGSFAIDNFTQTITIDNSEWRQYNIVRKAVSTSGDFALFTSGSSSTIQIGAMQVVEFSTANQAYEYLYRGRIAINDDTYAASTSLSAFTDIGGGGVAFNSASINTLITTSSYVTLCEANLKGSGIKISVDFLLAFQDFLSGTSTTQVSGFQSISFSSTSATPTLVIGAATLTFKLTNVSGNIWQLQAQSSGYNVVISGLAFIKGH